jgi:glyoxylase-like metal-dependent hydrolase (beta-lactamase superfamily II)
MFEGGVITRRTFLADLGRGTLALAVVGVAGCAPAGASSRPAGNGSAPPTTPPGSPPGSPPASEATSSSGAPPAGGSVTWERVNLGFVSAYILVRGGEAAVVDTGTEGSETEIAAALDGVGLGWDAVGHVIVTHRHGDHAGSAAAVLEAAADATGYAGAEDIAAIGVPRPLTAVADGEDVFGLRIVTTPGHTAGHIAVLDEAGGILVAGDALGTSGGTVSGSNPQFTDDETAALASVAKLGALSFETLLVGHGDPITSGASALVAALAAGS